MTTEIHMFGRCPAREREYYRSKSLNYFFSEFKYHPIARKNKKRVLADYQFMAGTGYLKEKNEVEASKRFYNSLLLRPLHLKSYIYFLLSFLKLTKLQIW